MPARANGMMARMEEMDLERGMEIISASFRWMAENEHARACFGWREMR